jgi:hypothetical protein
VQDGRSTAPPLRRLHMPSISSKAWRVSFAGGSLDYAELSAEEVRQHSAHASTLARVPARKMRGALVMARTGKPLTAAAAADAGGDEDDGWSWGDIWEGVKGGAAVVYDYVVQPVVDAVSGAVDAVSTVITLVIDGVHHVFTCLIDLVEQVFDLVEEALRWIGVQFEQLFRWLGEVMGWAGIMRTKEVIKQQLLNMLQLASMVVPVLEAKLAGQITTFGAWASAKMDQFNQLVLGDQSTLGATRLRAQNQTTPALASTMHRSQGLNLVGNAFVNNLGRVPDVAGGSGAELAATRMAALPADVAAPVTDLLGQLASTGQAWSSAQAFEDALAYLSRIPGDPEHMLQLVFAALVSACKGILQLVLDAALVVLQQLALAIQAVLSSIEQAWTAPGPWRIPFVSALYEKLSGGGQLSPIDLTALMLAMPTTWLYRAAHDAPPFPDDASLASFNATYSTALLAKHMGLSQASMPNAAALAETDPPEPSPAQVTVAQRVFLWLNAVNNVVYSFVDIFLDLQLSPELGVKYNLKSLDSSATQQNIGSWVAYSLGWTGLLCGMPWYDLSKMLPGCDNPDQFGAIHLIVEGVENLINSIFFFAGGALMRTNDTFGPYLASGFGFVHLVMNAVESGWAASLHEGNVWEALEGVFGSIPLVFKFLHATPVIEASEGTSWIGLLVIDAIGDVVMIACGIAHAATA